MNDKLIYEMTRINQIIYTNDFNNLYIYISFRSFLLFKNFGRFIPVFYNRGFGHIILRIKQMELPLTQNGIVHISAGFDGPFILQVFGLRKQPTNPHLLNMCLTDGEIYIGAIYNAPKFFDLQNYNVVRVTAQYFDRSKPITVKTLEIVSKSNKKLIGNAPCTLVDFFNKEINPIVQSEPKKKVKISMEDFCPIILPDNSPKVNVETKPILKNQPAKQQTVAQKPQKKNKVNGQNNDKKGQKKLQLASESQEDYVDLQQSSPDNFKATFMKESVSPVNTIPINPQDMIENSFIRDLFERHTGWVILCRVNYRSLARCENGLYAVNFVLSDQSGDEIKCVYFQASIQKAKEMLKVGKYYLFACGQIKQTKQQELQIIFDRNSQFIQKQNVSFQINPKKITRIDRILQEQPETQINVIGIIRKIKNKGEKLKTKNKYTATICDPITNYQIDFLLFLNEDEKPIQKGMIVVLHSYQVYRQNNICRLNSTYRSYYYEQKPSKTQDRTDLVNQFFKITQQSGWDNQNYKNISMFAFTQRSIYELKNIYKKTQDDRTYSSVDCWVMQIAKKKAYYACKTCKKPTQKKQMGLFQCSHCKKMVEVILTYTLSVTFTDYTGSCMIDVIGQHAENLLQRKALQFYSLPNQDQNNHLQALRYKNVQLRLKTQKKSQNKLAHSVWGIQRTTPQTSLKQIKKLLNQKTCKLDDKW